MPNRFRLLTAGGPHQSAGLLVLRIGVAGSMLFKHGFEKVFTFSAMAQNFPDPIHIGGAPSLAIAMIADFICSILIIIGLATRWAALFSLGNLLVAWALVHDFAYVGKGGPSEHGETIVLYILATLALVVSGAGRYSLDDYLTRPHLQPVA